MAPPQLSLGVSESRDLDVQPMQQKQGKGVIQGAFPLIPAAIYAAKVAAQTTLDAFLDMAIGAITGAPPGVLDYLTNLVFNLIPVGGSAHTARKTTKLALAVDDVIGAIRGLRRLRHLRGSIGRMVTDMTRYKDQLIDFIKNGDLQGAKRIWNQLIGTIREAQVAAKMAEQGENITDLQKNIKRANGSRLTEIDAISTIGDRTVYTQVKTGDAANITRGSNAWSRLQAQIDRTVEAADQVGGDVRFVVDNVSDEAREYMESKGIRVILSADFF